MEAEADNPFAIEQDVPEKPFNVQEAYIQSGMIVRQVYENMLDEKAAERIIKSLFENRAIIDSLQT